LQEYDFLDEICLAALHMSKEVKFVAVIDKNAKLISGKYRKEDYINSKLIRTRLLQLSSKENGHKDFTTTTFCEYNTNYLLYANYLIAAIKKIGKVNRCLVSREELESTNQPIDLVQIHGILKLAITPLTASNDRYLCIYLESSSPNQEILANIRNTI
jgi:hypothetical protein